jgi:hypothetical protein
LFYHCFLNYFESAMGLTDSSAFACFSWIARRLADESLSKREHFNHNEMCLRDATRFRSARHQNDARMTTRIRNKDGMPEPMRIIDGCD